MEQKSSSTLYPQLANLYSVDYWQKNIPITNDESLYITPEGNIFVLKYRGFLSHSNFSKLLYENYAAVKEALKDKEVLKSNLEDVIGDSVELKDVYDYYRQIIAPIDFVDHDKFSEARRETEEDMIPVQDMGFLKIVGRVGSTPELGVPLPLFGRKATPEQLETAEIVLEQLQKAQSHKYNQDFEVYIKERDIESYIKQTVRRTTRLSTELSDLLDEVNKKR